MSVPRWRLLSEERYSIAPLSRSRTGEEYFGGQGCTSEVGHWNKLVLMGLDGVDGISSVSGMEDYDSRT